MAATKNILIVEDNPANLQLAAFLLQTAGFTTGSAGNGAEAIEAAKSGKYQLILMDIEMPGMDGLTATQLIKADAALAHIPILALTAYAMKGDKERCMAAGCSGYITKPINTQEFVRTVSGFFPGANAPHE
jgi:two-component system cell cycle response regulator DivK